jgi:hypothetical protein
MPKSPFQGSSVFREFFKSIMQKGCDLMMIKINEWCNYMWENYRTIWYMLIAFTAGCVWLSLKMLPYSWFEMIIDPVVLVLLMAKTIERIIRS